MSDDLRRLNRKRKSTKASIDVISKYVNRFDPSVHSHRQLQIRLTRLLILVSEYNTLQNEIMEIDIDNEDDEEHLSVEDETYTLIATMEELLEKHSPPSIIDVSHASQPIAHDTMRLPAINIPTFNGKIEDWPSFIDTFNALIHNNHTLSNIQKFHYLKTSIIGSAADIIKNLTITAENYQPAYDELHKQYENKTLIIQTHIRAILHSPKVHTANANELRKLHNHIVSHVRALQSLRQPVNHWDAWLVTITCCQLDAATAGEWQLIQSTNELPSFVALERFLSKRISAYDIGNIAANFTEKSTRSRSLNHNSKHVEGKAFFVKKTRRQNRTMRSLLSTT